MSSIVLYHAGHGYASLGSVTGPIEEHVLGGVATVRYELGEHVVLSTLGNARRIPEEHRSAAITLAAKLNAREGHHRWRALSWAAACEIERAA